MVKILHSINAPSNLVHVHILECVKFVQCKFWIIYFILIRVSIYDLNLVIDKYKKFNQISKKKQKLKYSFLEIKVWNFNLETKNWSFFNCHKFPSFFSFCKKLEKFFDIFFYNCFLFNLRKQIPHKVKLMN